MLYVFVARYAIGCFYDSRRPSVAVQTRDVTNPLRTRGHSPRFYTFRLGARRQEQGVHVQKILPRNFVLFTVRYLLSRNTKIQQTWLLYYSGTVIHT